MHYYKALIQYAGTNYAGFQEQENIPTVQKAFNQTLRKLLVGKVTTVGASRTDSGVHAFDQVVKITSESPIDADLISRFNLALPHDIRCLEITDATSEFRPSAHTTSKEYRYYFTNKIPMLSDDKEFIANISNPLDLDKIRFCLLKIMGEHDFCNFYSHGSNVKTTIRKINACELNEVNPHHIFNNNPLFLLSSDFNFCYEFKFSANGFLKQMIRHLVSALWMVGSGKITTDEFLRLLEGPKEEKQLRKVAPACGLYLFKINYE